MLHRHQMQPAVLPLVQLFHLVVPGITFIVENAHDVSQRIHKSIQT